MGQLSFVLYDDGRVLGFSLLFSAGTFLFTIAVHILPNMHQQAQGETGTDSTQHEGVKEKEKMTWEQVCAMIIGILLPLILSS